MSEAAWSETVWNVVLRLSLVSCPVRLVPAVAPIDREFETLLAGSGGILDLTHFIRSDPVERARVATSYDLYPNGSGRGRDARRAACRRCGAPAATRVAFVSHGEGERMLLIEPYGGGLRLSVMRRPLVAPGVYEEPAERQVPTELIEMAEAVIARHLHDGGRQRAARALRKPPARADRRQKTGGSHAAGDRAEPGLIAGGGDSRSRRQRNRAGTEARIRRRRREPRRQPMPPLSPTRCRARSAPRSCCA